MQVENTNNNTVIVQTPNQPPKTGMDLGFAALGVFLILAIVLLPIIAVGALIVVLFH